MRGLELGIPRRSFSELLKEHRLAADLSQEELAERARLSVETISALERGRRQKPYRDTIARLANALQLSVIARTELEMAASPSRSSSVVAGARPQLPLQATSLVGRESDIPNIVTLLEENRLVTITGSGGVGKTRVALEVARLSTGHWEDIRFVDLSPLSDRAFIAGAIVSTASGDAAGSAEGVAAALRSSHVLLVLDNCEHLIAHVARLVATILQECPDVSFLCTSRERLAVGGEAVYRLPSLAVPLPSPMSLKQARDYPGVELFVQRATASDRAVAFSDASAEGIAEICRRLDGMPLAIELAAARVATLGLEPLRVRLREGLALTGGARNLPARQQTMNATINWSYDLLSEPERLLLQRTSIFAGGFTLAAAESVCATNGIDANDVAELISSLVEKSLVNVKLSEYAPRYTMLDSVRSFALARLREAQQVASISRRHAEWVATFADWIDTVRTDMTEPRLRAEWEPELENARVALTWALAQQSEEGALLAGRIVGGLRIIWITSRRNSECTRWAKAALAGIDEERYPNVVAPVLRALIQVSPDAEALAWTERAIPLFERLGDWVGLALIYSYVSWQRCVRGRPEEAEQAMARASELFALHNESRSIPYVTFLSRRVWLRIQQGRFEEALADCTTGLAIVTDLGDPLPCRWLRYRAEVEFAMGHTDVAIGIAEDIVARANELGANYTQAIIDAYGSIACFRVASGDTYGGYTAAREALVLSRRDLDYLNHENIETLDVMAFVAASHGDAPLAARLKGAVDAAFDGSTPATWFSYAAVRKLLNSLLNGQLSPQELKRLQAEGSSFNIDRARAEALAIRSVAPT